METVTEKRKTLKWERLVYADSGPCGEGPVDGMCIFVTWDPNMQEGRAEYGTEVEW